MKKYKFPKLDNRGASLLMVIIGLAFIAVIGAIAVSAALINNDMKSIDRKSKYNFYSAEAAMDEIRIGLEEDTASSLSQAYQAVMVNYSAINDTMRKILFYNTFAEKLKTALQVNLVSNVVSITKMNNYLKETKRTDPSSDGAQVTGTPVLEEAISKDYLLLKGVGVNYQTDGFTTTITTDIKINIPKEEWQSGSQTPYLDYALIADKALIAKFTDNCIIGSIYAGSEGINTGLGNTVEVLGSRIVSKGDITVKNLGEFKFSGTNAEIWANNLITTQTDKTADVTHETNIMLRGDCYIKDDLVLGAKKSCVTINGNYYGYSSGAYANNNSAIIINASNAKLDLSGLHKLYLAGRSFLSLEDGGGAVSYQEDNTYGLNSGANCNILTGESLAIKGSQNAYLLPGEFLAVGHNPVSWNEYKSYYSDTADLMVTIPSDAVVFPDATIKTEERRLLYYLADTCPVKKAFYKFGSNDNVVYYYLNFKSQELATSYFKNYIKCYPDKINNGFPIDEVKINSSPGACMTAGNIMTYQSGVKLISGTNAPFTNNFAKAFANLTATLHKNCSGKGNTAENIVFENILDMDKINAAVHPEKKIIEKEIWLDGEACYICIIDNKDTNPFHYDLTGKRGIIVATGNISVDRDFTGLILSDAEIELNAGKVTADPKLVEKILLKDSETAGYFRAYSNVGESDVNLSDLIEYENWKKN